LVVWLVLGGPPVLGSPVGVEAEAGRVFDVRSYGALGDGQTLDTPAINRAISQCAESGGGVVRFPPGRYLSGTIRLRSHLTLELEAGATLVGTTNLSEYARPTPPADLPEARWGNWHRGLIIGEGLEDVAIVGPGTIDGSKVFDPRGEERMRGPHTIVFVDCRRMKFRDLTLVDSANYAVFFMVSDDVEFRDLHFIGGWDGIHWRGGADRWCRNVEVIDCRFETGDDAIAGRYWENTLITGCVINSSCNGLRLIGPARNLVVHDNLFFGPGRQPHRTSGERRRTNMLSGIILQPGAWDATRGPLDDVLLSDNTMRQVASPVTVWAKPGNTIGRVVIEGLRATGVYRSALSVESWAEEPAREVVLRDAAVEFSGGGTAEMAGRPVDGPGVDARALPAWGVYARNVGRFILQDVRLNTVEPDHRPVVFAERVGVLSLDHFRYPAHPSGDEPLVLREVERLESIPSLPGKGDGVVDR